MNTLAPRFALALAALEPEATHASDSTEHDARPNHDESSVDALDPENHRSTHEHAPFLTFVTEFGSLRGIGGGLRFGSELVGVMATGAYQPLFDLERTTPCSILCFGLPDHAEFDGSAQFDGSLAITPLRHAWWLGVSIGYTFNTIYGHGVGTALVARSPRAHGLGAHGQLGIVVFPVDTHADWNPLLLGGFGEPVLFGWSAGLTWGT